MQREEMMVQCFKVKQTQTKQHQYKKNMKCPHINKEHLHINKKIHNKDKQNKVACQDLHKIQQWITISNNNKSFKRKKGNKILQITKKKVKQEIKSRNKCAKMLHKYCNDVVLQWIRK